MSDEPVKKKHLSGAEKRKKRLDQQNKRDEVLKKTQNLFQLGYVRQPLENQPFPSTATSAADQTGSLEADSGDIPSECSEQANQDQEAATLTGAEVSEAENEFQSPVPQQNVAYQDVGYQNDIGLWKNITKEIQDYWCIRDFNECQHFDCDFSASSRQYEDSKRFFLSQCFFVNI